MCYWLLFVILSACPYSGTFEIEHCTLKKSVLKFQNTLRSMGHNFIWRCNFQKNLYDILALEVWYRNLVYHSRDIEKSALYRYGYGLILYFLLYESIMQSCCKVFHNPWKQHDLYLFFSNTEFKTETSSLFLHW